MATYRLMDGLSGRPGNGPGAPSAYAGNIQAGTAFQVTAWNTWLQGFYHWVPAGGDTVARKFTLWQVTNLQTGTLIPAATVTSGTLTAGQWNFVPLATPVPLSASIPYMASTAWVAVNGFPETISQFGSTQPYAAGITSGPLNAYSDTTGSDVVPNSWSSQGAFGTATSDPATLMPNQGDRSANFWMDVQVSDTAPAVTSYRLWPSLPVPNNMQADSALNFTLATEFKLSKSCALNKIWFYSPSGATQLPTACGIWNVAGQALVPGTNNSSPSWSGAAGSGWISCPYAGVTLPAGDYKTSVFNGAGSPTVWANNTVHYWDTGGGAGGITAGPLSAPNEAGAAAPGQGTFHQGVTFAWPDTYTGGATPAQNYWVDVEVTPVASGGLLMASFP